MNSDIFYKPSNKKTPHDESSSVFTSETPKKNVIDNNSESSYINEKLRKIHKSVLDSDFIPMKNTDTETMTGGKHTESSAKHTSSAHHTSSAKRTSSAKSATLSIPLNYSESTTNISPYYSSDYVYKSSSTSYSSTSSESSYSSTSSDTEDKRKKPIKKKTIKKTKPKTNAVSKKK